MTCIKFKKLHPDAIPFAYAREHDACMDMYACADLEIQPGEVKIVPTGISVEIPPSYEGIVRGRSGLASKGIVAHVGTIDETYRGDVGIILTNHSKETFKVSKGARVAQFTIKPVTRVELSEVTELSNTERGANGYGSSGI